MLELLEDEQIYALLDVLQAMKPAHLLPLAGGDQDKALEAYEGLMVVLDELKHSEGL